AGGGWFAARLPWAPAAGVIAPPWPWDSSSGTLYLPPLFPPGVTFHSQLSSKSPNVSTVIRSPPFSGRASGTRGTLPLAIFLIVPSTIFQCAVGTVSTAHWKIVDGTIKKIASGKVPRVPDGRPLDGGDLMTVETFGDFELSWEWKVTPGANSGVKYNVSEELSQAQGGAMTPAAVAQGSIAPNHSALGFEYQMLDDDHHPDGQLPTHRAGALYDLVAPSGAKHLRPVGEWNQSRVVFRGNHGEHWLNGEKIVEFELGTARMDSALAASKYHS